MGSHTTHGVTKDAVAERRGQYQGMCSPVIVQTGLTVALSVLSPPQPPLLVAPPQPPLLVAPPQPPLVKPRPRRLVSQTLVRLGIPG